MFVSSILFQKRANVAFLSRKLITRLTIAIEQLVQSTLALQIARLAEPEPFAQQGVPACCYQVHQYHCWLMLPVFIWTFCFSKVVYVSCIYPLRCQQSLWFYLFEFWQKWNHCSLLLRLVCYCFQVGRSIRWCIGNKFINLTENNGKLDELY